MKICRNMDVVLIVVTTLFLTGCTTFDSLIRSVNNPFGKKRAEIDTIILEEAREAYQAGNIILAEERYKEFVEKNQRSSDKASLAFAYSQLGRIAFEKSDFKASRRYFDKAIELDPENLDIFGMYAESLYWQKDYIRSEALFRQALQIAPNDSRFQIMLGRTLAQQKQYLLGQRYLKQALGEPGAYEELARIYDEHSEYEMAALASAKARESQTRKQQLAGNFPAGNVPTPQHGQRGRESGFPNTGYAVSNPPFRQPDNTMHVSQSPGAVQMQSYQPPQPPPQQQGQVAATQQVILPQQNFNGQQVSMQQYPAQQYPVQQYYVQQPVPQPSQQQPMMSANQGYSLPQAPAQNHGPMNPATVQQGQYPPGMYAPPPAVEANPQWQQDNRPPYGFAATGQPPPGFVPPPQQTQMTSNPLWQNGQEIAYHPNYAAAQPGMPSPTNPLADTAAPTWQLPAWPHENAAAPTYGNQSQNPVFSGFQ